MTIQKIMTVAGSDSSGGADCTYSAAVTAELANGKSVNKAVDGAKAFISEAIRNGFRLNEYVGSTWHSAYRNAMTGKEV